MRLKKKKGKKTNKNMTWDQKISKYHMKRCKINNTKRN